MHLALVYHCCWYLGFLNFDDDDEEAEAVDDYVPDADVTRITENSGWSSRTRCVACAFVSCYSAALTGLHKLSDILGKFTLLACLLFSLLNLARAKIQNCQVTQEAQYFQNRNVFGKGPL